MSQHRSASGLAGAARGMLAQENDGVIQSLEKICGADAGVWSVRTIQTFWPRPITWRRKSPAREGL